MESKKLMVHQPNDAAVYKDFYKTYYNEKLKVFKIVAEIVGLIAIFGAFYILANGYGILWGAIALWLVHFCFLPRMYTASHTKTQKTTVRQRTLLFLKIICRKKQNHM